MLPVVMEERIVDAITMNKVVMPFFSCYYMCLVYNYIISDFSVVCLRGKVHSRSPWRSIIFL